MKIRLFLATLKFLFKDYYSFLVVKKTIRMWIFSTKGLKSSVRKKRTSLKRKNKKKVETDEEIIVFKIKKSVLTLTDSFDIILVRF